MKYWRVGIALILTVLMLYVARTNSKGQPEQFGGTDNGVVFDLTTVPKQLEHRSASLTVVVGGLASDSHRVLFRSSEERTAPLESYDSRSMLPSERWVSDIGQEYWTEVTAGALGGKLWYYFEVTDSAGAHVARFLPGGEEPFLFKYIGEVPMWILLLHIVFIFATVFCISMTAVHAVDLLRSGGSARPVVTWLLWAAATCLMGMIPFGIPMNWYAFGSTWEGVPFGHDATDNKTQLLFVYLLFATLCGSGHLRRQPGPTACSPRRVAWLGIGSFAVMLFIYLIPHSIQFTPGFTYGFCWTWIGLVVLGYLLIRFRRRRTNSRISSSAQ